MKKKISDFDGNDILLYYNTVFDTKNGDVLRPIDFDLLAQQELVALLNVHYNTFKARIQGTGFRFPPKDDQPPIGYKHAYFYDEKYNVTGWNYQRIGTTIKNQFDTLEEANAMIQDDKATDSTPTLTIIPQYYQPLLTGIETIIKTGKVQVQCSSHSFGLGGTIDGHISRFSKDGKEIITISCADDELLRGAVYNNNHMNAFNIIFPEGEITLEYTNATNRDSIKTLGMGEIHNNDGYLFYGDPSLGLFNKRLAKGESHVAKFTIAEKDDYGWVAGESLHKMVKFNFIDILGRIVPANMEINYGNGQWYDYYGNFQVNSNQTIELRNKENHAEWVKLQLKVGNYGDTGSVTLLDWKGVTLSEKLIYISQWRRQFINYSSPQGMKEVTYKQFNNNIKDV